MSAPITVTLFTPEGTLEYQELTFDKTVDNLRKAIESGHGIALVQREDAVHPVEPGSDLRPVIVCGSNGRPVVGWVSPEISDAIESALTLTPDKD